MIIRTMKNENYTTLANFALNDPKLSLKAKGLWAFIMSKPDAWSINYRGLSSQLKEGQAAILSALKELEENNYLVRGQIRNDAGKFSQGDSVLYEQSCVELPRVDTPRVENPRTESSRTKVITNKVITKQVKTEEEITTNVVIGETPLTYGKPEINDLFSYWKQTTGVSIESNVQRNRNACNTLYKKYGSEKLRSLIDGVQLAQSTPYAPQIADFVELQFKLTRLLTWGKTRNQESQVTVIS